MFGNRLKIWMENYIVRPRKKEVQKEKLKGNDNKGGVILESSESLAHSDTGISSSSQQVLSSSTPDNREGYSTTTMESERSGTTHCHTAISLPSPESAYSTGYSTDGTSPGATGPPEYYINIRTGKHYFPSPTPTPTSPQPNTTFMQLYSIDQCLSTKLLSEGSEFVHSSHAVSSSCAKSSNQMPCRHPCNFSPHIDTFVSEIQDCSRRPNILFKSVLDQFENRNFYKPSCKKSSAKSQLASLKLFLKSPKRDKEKIKTDVTSTATSIFESKKRPASNGKPKKWFKQPFQKFGHRRTDSCGERIVQEGAKREIYFEKNLSRLRRQENSASPRQRNRIKTNPWLPTEPVSYQNFHNFRIDFSPSLTRNRSCSNTPLQNRKETQTESLQNHIKQLTVRCEEPKNHIHNLEKVVNRQVSGKLAMESNDHSDEDLTLNEMMGTYNESYVYEKETDILSDSDPTDCEDYETDSEADNGGDELDFIDNGSVTESDDNFPTNTGKCTYFDIHNRKNSFLRKTDRLYFKKSSESRKNSKKDQDSKTRREKKKQPRKSFKQDNEEKKKLSESKARPKAEVDGNIGGLNGVLAQKMRVKNISKSAEGTPATSRRYELIRELKETPIESEKEKVCEKKPLLSLGDIETDKKYKELIKEAENIFESLRNSPLIKKKSDINLLNDTVKVPHKVDPSVESINTLRKTQPVRGFRNMPSEPETSSRKSPKNLDLQLSVETPEKLQKLNFQANNQSSFKAMSSAHSPLDPLGPALRIFTVFKPGLRDERKISTSSSEDSENSKSFENKESGKKWNAFPKTPVVPIAFQSVDLGKPLTSYCPQSEPVKRKIYSCSKTYDKLVKQFENKSTIFEESIDVGERVFLAMNARNLIHNQRLETCLNGNQGSASEDQKNIGKKLLHEEALHCSLIEPKRLSTSGDSASPKKPQRRSLGSDIFRCNLP